jgi:DNA polymerase alpha subunit A
MVSFCSSSIHQPVTSEPFLLLVHSEFAEIATRHGITKFKAKKVTRKYCFEAKRDGVPNEAEVRGFCFVLFLFVVRTLTTLLTSFQFLKVVYSADLPILPRTLKGHTFSHVFGTQSSLLELLILKRRLMGPCWYGFLLVFFSRAFLLFM